MKKIILICLMSFLLTGCSLVKTITAPFKPIQNTLPQETNKSKSKVVCKGEYKVDEVGNIIYCSKGYYNYGENFKEVERKLTLKEKIIQFFEQLSGYLFWIVIILLILCPSLLGVVVGRIIEGTVGLAKKTLDSTIRAVQKARKQNVDLNTALSSELDTVNKKYIAKIKEQEKIK